MKSQNSSQGGTCLTVRKMISGRLNIHTHTSSLTSVSKRKRRFICLSIDINAANNSSHLVKTF